jgi:diguanylate cyclase (GGDEF)-like protein/excisionase family DNA binding protein
MNGPEATLSVTDAARVLGVHPNTLRAWSDAGRIRSYRINSRGDRRYRRADLDAFLDAAEMPAVEPIDAAAERSDRSEGTDRPAATPRAAAPPRSPAQERVEPPEPAPFTGPPDASAEALLRDELETVAALLGRDAAPSGLDGTLARIVRILRARHGHAIVAILAPDGDRLVVRASAGDPTPLPVLMSGDSLAARAYRDVEVISEVVAGADAAWLGADRGARVATAVAVPGPTAPWGVLIVADAAGAAVADTHPSMLSAIASIVGGAVRTARVVDEATRGRQRAEALRQAANELASELDFDRILASIVDHAMALFGADRAAILLGRPGGRLQAPLTRRLSPEFLRSITVFHAWSVPTRAMREKRPIHATRYFDDPGGEFQRDELLAEGIDTICSAPLHDGVEPIGVLNLYHDIARPWSEEDLETLAAFAAQASVSIRNAENFRRTEAWAAQLQSIQHLGGELGRLSSASEIGTAIVAEIERLIDFHNVRVYLIHGEDLAPISLRGKVGQYTDETEEALRVKVGEGITGWVAKHGIPQYLPDAEADPRTVTVTGTDEIEESMLLAPMVFEGRVLGVIVLSKLGIDQFTESDLRLLVIFSNTAAQAIATAEVTERLRRQTEALERRVLSQRALLQINESLLTTLDARAILDGITERLGELVSYDNLAIELVDPRTGTLRPIVARGVDADYYLAPWEPGEQGLATWVVAHGEPELVADERNDPRVAQSPEQGPIDGSIICAPLRGPAGVVGVLTVERLGTASRYGEDDLELVRLFAGQVSVALRNAEHYRAARVRAETDGLTGLLNFASFREKLGELTLVGERFSLLMIDLDGFKAMNSAYLYQGGNVVLRRVASAIDAAARDTDDVFRFGGDEFCVLLPNTDAEGARQVAERVRAAVAAVEPPAGGHGRSRPRVSASIGSATFPVDATTDDALVDIASRGSFYAKANGGDRVATPRESAAIADAFEPTGPTRVESETTAVEELIYSTSHD